MLRGCSFLQFFEALLPNGRYGDIAFVAVPCQPAYRSWIHHHEQWQPGRPSLGKRLPVTHGMGERRTVSNPINSSPLCTTVISVLVWAVPCTS